MFLEPRAHWHVRDDRGRRKYLTDHERGRLLAIADQTRPDVRALFYLMTFAGCRVSEALALTRGGIDTEAATVTFRTLKRRKISFRTVPVPVTVIEMLAALPVGESDRFWTMHRATAWRHLKRLLAEAGVHGPMACCRGLRHGFGMRAAARSVPANLIQRWMGHAFPTTTAIYLDAVGEEERQFAERMW